MILLVIGILGIIKIAKWGCRLGLPEKRQGKKQGFRSQLQRGAAKPRRLHGIPRGVQIQKSKLTMP